MFVPADGDSRNVMVYYSPPTATGTDVICSMAMTELNGTEPSRICKNTIDSRARALRAHPRRAKYSHDDI